MTTERTGGTARARVARCLAYAGRGSPDGAKLEAAIEAVNAVAAEVRNARRRSGHDFRPGAAEIRFEGPPPGGRGGPSWRVIVRVPAQITERDVKTAAAEAGALRSEARNVRLEPVGPSSGRGAAVVGRDRMPGAIRKTRTGAIAQHRARELG